jgi:hypothetical protein
VQGLAERCYTRLMKERTSKEINQLVAEHIMGWTPKPCNLEETKREVIYYDDGYVECPCCKVNTHIDEFKHGIIPPLHYSTDMNAAWLVLQHMVQRYVSEDGYPPFLIFAKVLLSNYSGNERFPCQTLFEIVVKWSPEIICKAALKAIGAI